MPKRKRRGFGLGNRPKRRWQVERPSYQRVSETSPMIENNVLFTIEPSNPQTNITYCETNNRYNNINSDHITVANVNNNTEQIATQNVDEIDGDSEDNVAENDDVFTMNRNDRITQKRYF